VIQRQCAGTPHNDHHRQCNGKEVIFEAVPFPVAEPVEEQTVTAVHHEDCGHHGHADSESSQAAQQADYEASAAKEFGGYRQEGHRNRRRNPPRGH